MSGKGKLVCVTGASGYIASWLVKLLLDRGYTIRASVRDPSKNPNLLFLFVFLSFLHLQIDHFFSPCNISLLCSTWQDEWMLYWFCFVFHWMVSGLKREGRIMPFVIEKVNGWWWLCSDNGYFFIVEENEFWVLGFDKLTHWLIFFFGWVLITGFVVLSRVVWIRERIWEVGIFTGHRNEDKI